MRFRSAVGGFVAIACAVGGLSLLAPSTAALAAAATQPIMTVNSSMDPHYSQGQQYFSDAGAVALNSTSSLTSGIFLNAAGTGHVGLEVIPRGGQSLHDGLYTGVNSSTSNTQPILVVSIDSWSAQYVGSFDILDISAGTNGQLQRFDVVFDNSYTAAPGALWGEAEMGEPHSTAVDVGARNLELPSTPVRSAAVKSTEWIHNTSAGAVAIGTAAVTSGAKSDYAISSDGCSGKTLAAGATCSLKVGFSPTAGGPRDAVLSLPIGSTTQSVSLAGTAPLGTTSLTTSGNDFVDTGTPKAGAGPATTHTFTNGPYQIIQQPQDGITFGAYVPYNNGVLPTGQAGPLVTFGGPGGTLALGTHTVTYPFTGAMYGLNVTGFNRGCSSYTGTENVHSYISSNGDPSGDAAMADISFSISCERDTAAPMTGTLLWQSRSDTTAPNAVTGLAISSGSNPVASWKASTSSDVASMVARLVPGDGADATPTSGYSLTFGSATSAALPALNTGERYAVVVFAIDATGNVSSAATHPITEGTPLPVITVPSAPTAVKAVAGNASAVVSFTPPSNNGGTPIVKYQVVVSPGVSGATGTSSPITVGKLVNGQTYTFTVLAFNQAGTSLASTASAPVTPKAPATLPPPSRKQLLPDSGFESGTGGWSIFTTAKLTSVTRPVHSGAHALEVGAVSARTGLVGLTENTVIPNSVAGATYTASCWVEPTAANLNVNLRFLEYAHDFSSDIHLVSTTVAKLPVGVWTHISVTGTSVKSGDRMIPQIYSTNETTSTGSIIYDDCSVTAG